MSNGAMVSTPPMKAVAMEQLRVLGLALRREGLLLCAGLVGFAVILPFFEAELGSQAQPFVMDPSDFGYLGIVIALVAPLGVWKGERQFGESPLWMAPVDHARHARLKIAFGWVWLMAVVAFGYVAIVTGITLAGGTVGVEGIRLVVPDPNIVEPVAEGSLTSVPWSTPLWQWMLPFTAATVVYIAASAFLVGIKHPVIWGAAIWIGLLGMGEVGEVDRLGWLERVSDRVVYLFDLLGSGGSQYAHVSWCGTRAGTCGHGCTCPMRAAGRPAPPCGWASRWSPPGPLRAGIASGDA